MSKAVFVLALAALLVGSATAVGSAVERKAKLTVVKGKPLALRGTGFEPRESVRITLLAGIKRNVRRATASPAGSFRVSIAPAADGCSLLIAHAVGARGSRASVRFGGPPCPPPR
jgi:hypothetical protein